MFINIELNEENDGVIIFSISILLLHFLNSLYIVLGMTVSTVA